MQFYDTLPVRLKATMVSFLLEGSLHYMVSEVEWSKLDYPIHCLSMATSWKIGEGGSNSST